MEDTVYQSILIGDSEAAAAGVVKALGQGIDPVRILNGQMIAAMGKLAVSMRTKSISYPR